MRLKVAYQRQSGSPVDLVITTDPTTAVGEIAADILATDPLARRGVATAAVTLSVKDPWTDGWREIDPGVTVADAGFPSGADLRVVPAGSGAGPAQRGSAVDMIVESGPEAGKRFGLGRGQHVIGRSPSSDVVLVDPMVSKSHARLQIGESVELVDLNSANGLLVDGGLVPRLTVRDGQTVEMGDSLVRFQVTGAVTTAAARISNGAVPHNRAPRVEERYPGREYPAPDIPAEIEPAMFPWVMMAIPVVMGVAMFAYTGRAITLLFIAMSPLMLLGNYFMSRQRNKFKHAAEVTRFESQMVELDSLLAAEVPIERRIREQESPTSASVRADAERCGDLLWTRRPEHWSFLHLRLATGTSLSRNAVGEQSGGSRGIPEFAARLDELVERYRVIDGVPIVENLVTAGAIGIVGGASAHDAARALMAQLCGLHAPSELVVAAIAGAEGAREFDWIKWLPHTSSAHSPFAGSHLAESAASGAAMLARLEELVLARSTGAEDAFLRPPLEATVRATAAGAHVGEAAGSWEPPKLPVVVVLVTDDAPVERGRLVQLLERAPAAGVFALYVAESREHLPALCRTWVDVGAGTDRGLVEFVRHGSSVRDAQVETLGRAEALGLARRMAGVADSGAFVADESDLPRTVSLVSLVGEEMAESASAVVDRWTQNHSVRRLAVPGRGGKRPQTLRALVGQAGADAMHLDLRTQGPHALVGGTTGAGKSEFLQAWVLGMAAEYSPERVTFLFVDYKGGSAFADCVDLPHCVGLVTDLNPHLVIRALDSLRAELRHREHILNRKKVKDLLELEKRGDPDCPPALVLVIDEFAALVGEVPEFVEGVVDVAQRGRSLGIHLIMATQRPAGVIRDNLRANTNLRIALRMADESDSDDVIGSSVAAGFDPTIPGRAIAKTGPGRLSQFQSAYAGGWSNVATTLPASAVQELRFGADIVWERPEDDQPVEPDDRGPTDQQRLVQAMRAASVQAGVEPPRRPWLPELERTYDLRLLRPQTDAELVLGLGDLPHEQEQRAVHFRPDEDGHLAIYGTGGSGKSGVLRTLAVSAAITPKGGPVEVYALDFSSGGLRMLETLPHVAGVITGEDPDRVIRMLRRIKAELDRRGREYPRVDADSISAYRTLAGRPEEPRILLLVDGFPAFRAEYEGVAGRGQWYGVFQQILTEGRQLGIHVALTADRPASVPGSVASSIPRRVVLRLAEETMYTVLDVPTDVLGPDSPPGRCVVDQVETQIAVLGGSGSAAEQSATLVALGQALRQAGRADVEPILPMPDDYPSTDLPDDVAGLTALGISEETLGPVAFEPAGAFLLGGGPGSGRTTALKAISRALTRSHPRARTIHLGGRRSDLSTAVAWDRTATGAEEVAQIAKDLAQDLQGIDPAEQRVFVVIEALSDFRESAAEAPLVELIKTIKRTGHFVVAESETSTWSASWPLFGEVKSARRGLLLQPDQLEGELILKATFPRGSRAEFPPGRGYLVDAGKVVRVQVPGS